MSLGFYNMENLFDTIDDPNTRDEAHTPEGRYRWNNRRYTRKLNNLRDVIIGMGDRIGNEPPWLLGVCEIENSQVLEDLVRVITLGGSNYKYIHKDSPDDRGIDVALLYKPAKFLPTYFRTYGVLVKGQEGYRDHSRDILLVEGWLQEQKVYIMVNHWPSRSGGRARSEAFRMQAARVHRRITDSIFRLLPEAAVISMGDYNDNPPDNSLLYACQSNTPGATLYNPMKGLYQGGMGSLAYRDSWHLFDQILVSETFLSKGNFKIIGAGIYAPARIKIRNGPHAGYPWRTYTAGRYSGGYSDHFPVYLILETRSGKPLGPGDTGKDE